MTELGAGQCPPDLLGQVLSAVKVSEVRGMELLDVTLRDYPGDPRLHFLRGSLLAGRQLYEEARREMAAAVQLAPGYAVARFQLGFLELTSGLPREAEATWGPLDALDEHHPLRLFAAGLRHLAHDRFGECIAALRQGMEVNIENPPINADMQLILDKLESDGLASGANEPVSATHLLLQQYASKDTRH
ncbi:MAG TPA: hypothetical protein VGI95_21870 [Caulobacteraceae bacterium]|jgi:hypothetical protein